METVTVEFHPLPPDDARSLCERLVKVAKDFGLTDCRLVMKIPADANSWRFCKRMRRSCLVSVFHSD